MRLTVVRASAAGSRAVARIRTRVDCDGHLKPINAPAPAAVSENPPADIDSGADVSRDLALKGYFAEAASWDADRVSAGAANDATGARRRGRRLGRGARTRCAP